MATPLRTSYEQNQSPEIFPHLSWFTVKCGLFGLLLGMILVGLTKTIPIVPVILAIGSPIVGFILGQKMIRGKWQFEGREKMLGRIKSLFSSNKVDLEKETAFKVNRENGIAVLVGANFNPIDSFELEESDTKILAVLYRTLLQETIEGFKVFFIRNSLSAPSMRRSLEKAKTFKSYIFIEYKEKAYFNQTLKDNITRLFSERARLMTPQEGYNVIQKIVQPEAEYYNFEEKKHLRTIGIDIRKELATFQEVGKYAITMTMAEMPKKIGDEFQRLLDNLGSCAGAVSVSFENLGDVNLFEEHLQQKILKSTGKTKYDPGSGERTNLKVSIGALAHGSATELKEMMEDFSREYSHISDPDELPVFARENYYMKEAILMMLPGQGSPLAHRGKKVESLTEAVRYIPMPISSGPDQGFISLRTEFNSIFNFPLEYNKPLYIWAAPQKGKSAMLSLFLLTHLKKPKAASFSMEAGGTFSFLAEGLSDVNIILKMDEGAKKWMPLEDHPLKLLLFYGESGEGAAIDWVMELTELRDDGEIKTLIEKGVRQLGLEGKYLLSDLTNILDEMVQKKNERKFSTAFENIKKFARGGRFGHVFEPEEIKQIDYNKARHFYVSQKAATKEDGGLLRAFFSYGLSILFAAEKRFDVSGPDPCDMLITVDEINHLVSHKAIDWGLLRKLNSQGRKQGKYVCCASQSLTDAMISGSDAPYEILESYNHFFFASGVSDIKHVKNALGSTADLKYDPSENFQIAIDKIEMLRFRGRGYAWGYLEKNGNIRILMIDISKEDQWAMTSHKAARMLLNETIRVNECSYWQACELLALYGPGNLPVSRGLSEEQKTLMFNEMRKHVWENTNVSV